jgi:glycerol-3-phosphate dehydrogenase
VANGAELLLNTKVTGIRRTENGYVITSDDQEFFARAVVNCAGLSADRILEAVQKPCVRIFPEAGDYYVLDTKAGGMIRHVIFHEPEEKEKGLTLVPTVDGNILLGPTKVSASGLEAFAVSREGLKELAALVPRVIPDLPMEHVIRSFGAVRPNPFRVAYDAESGTYVTQEESISDFTVHESGEAPGFLSFVGIKPPGLTCAAALGEYAAERISLLLHAEPKETFNPMRAMPLRLNTLSPEEAAKLAAVNPAYGRIGCRCRKVTEGEIVDSIRRFPGAVTVDGVKRRTGACSGRCQGSYCTQKIIEIIARDRGIPPSSVQKDGRALSDRRWNP